MTYPIGEVVAGVVVALALGAGTLLVLPQSAPNPGAARETIGLDVDGPAAQRADPPDARTDIERVEALERELSALAAEHRELSDRVKAIAREASLAGDGRQRKATK